MDDDERAPLFAIRQAIERIEQLVSDRSLDDYSDDWAVKWAVERAIEIISEASRRIPSHLRQQHSEIEWSKIHGIGNVLRHDYDEIIDRVIYETVILDLPALKIAVTAIAASLHEPEE